MYLSIYLLVVEWVNVCGAYCNQPMEICDLNVLSNSNTGNNSVIYHTRWHNNITANHVFFFCIRFTVLGKSKVINVILLTKTKTNRNKTISEDEHWTEEHFANKIYLEFKWALMIKAPQSVHHGKLIRNQNDKEPK